MVKESDKLLSGGGFQIRIMQASEIKKDNCLKDLKNPISSSQERYFVGKSHSVNFYFAFCTVRLLESQDGA